MITHNSEEMFLETLESAPHWVLYMDLVTNNLALIIIYDDGEEYRFPGPDFSEGYGRLDIAAFVEQVREVSRRPDVRARRRE